MKIKEWLQKFKREEEVKKQKEESSAKPSESVEYNNRFVKFYHLNKERLNQERRGSYSSRKKEGVCVRCKNKSLPGIVFCEYHQSKQKEYNKTAREK